jgi:hypothetical protein
MYFYIIENWKREDKRDERNIQKEIPDALEQIFQ